MITLYQFPSSEQLPSLSPYCLRVETYLKMAGIDYDNEFVRNPAKAPKGKLPYISDGGLLVADSSLIIDHLERIYHPDFGIELSTQEKVLTHTTERMIMEYTCWSILWTRWKTPTGWEQLEKLFFGAMPWHTRLWLPKLVRRKMLADLKSQGLSRHTDAELKDILRKDFSALSDILGDKSFFFGEVPTRLDATVFSFLANVYRFPIEGLLMDVAEKYPLLKSYADRMMNRVWGDY